MKFLFLLFLGILLPFLSGFSQNVQDLINKANESYENEDYIKALNYYNHIVNLDSISPEILKKRGNCYMELNQLDSALYNFKQVIQLDSGYVDVIYNIGNIYEMKGDLSSAKLFFNTFNRLKPNDIYGLLRLADIQKQQNQSDSAYMLFEKAYLLDSNNLFVIGELAWEYYERLQFDQSIYLANRGKSYDSLDINFYLICGLSHMAMMNAQAAFNEFEFALAMQPDNYDILMLKIDAQLLNNTDKNLIWIDSAENYRFNDMVASNLSLLDSWVTNPASKYYFPTLKEKYFKENGSLGFDSYFMFYYGQAFEPDYSPYSTSKLNLEKLSNEGNFQQIVQLKDDIYAQRPVNPDNIFLLALAYAKLNNKIEFKKELRNYHGFMKGLIATGNGQSIDSAFIVLSPIHEYIIINYLGYKSIGQALLNQNGHSYDRLETIDPEENEGKFYFIIDKPYKSLSDSLAPKKRNKNPQKKKKNKID